MRTWRSRMPIVTMGMGLLAMLVACGGEDPTPTSRPAPTPTPTAETMMEGDPTPTPGAMMEEDPTPTPVPTDSGAAAPSQPTATATPTPRPPTPTPPPGFDAAEYFRGKTVRIVANSSPGGGTDTQGRVMAAFMSQHIPGNPRVVFTNQPNKPLEYIYAATEAPKDGTYISWNSSPQLNFGFNESTRFIKRSTFEPVGSTIDPTRAWLAYDVVGNLGADAADKCIWEFSGMSGTGGGRHDQFLLADELSDIADGNPTLLAHVYAAEQLDIPFRYFGFDTVDTNALFLMWARGDVNSTIQPSFWHRFPFEHPDWLQTGFMRMMGGFGPGQVKPNVLGEPPCGDVRDHFDEEQKHIFNSMTGPSSYALKALWLPPGTPDHIADAISAAFEEALTTNEELITKYSNVAGESPAWVGRDELTEATIYNEGLLEGSQALIDEQAARLLPKYFAEYISG